MEVRNNAGTSPQIFGTDEQSAIENKKQEQPQKTAVQTEDAKKSSGSPKEASSKKAEYAFTEQSKATELNWKMDAKLGARQAVLERNSKGLEVESLQIRINEYREAKGLPPIKVDGRYGPQTEEAVREFQHTKGINDDGKAGPETLNAANLTFRVTELGMEGKRVLYFQSLVNNYRKSVGLPPIKEDGIYGRETEKAVREFQEGSGTRVDGRLGPETGRDLIELDYAIRKHRLMEEEAKVMQAEAQSEMPKPTSSK